MVVIQKYLLIQPKFEGFPVVLGTRQEDALPAILFNTVLHSIINKISINGYILHLS